ncbi:transcription factor 15-like isoform X2 [Daktulosphaira vitifoliae]|uniref:transcription factor 15-like isoform X2 n=1 Tax=Daktulosphaira vitifoliae TaxID=58002 RepID=UPI0021A988AA|nr:transcription factor 15-like isoform X2 [Daktulosphaira vitifoliae]
MYNNNKRLISDYFQENSNKTTNGVFHKRTRTGANARERDRTQSVNASFDILRSLIPIDPSDRKLSKIETLQLATKYIHHLSQLVIEGSDDSTNCSAYDVCIFCLTNRPNF